MLRRDEEINGRGMQEPDIGDERRGRERQGVGQDRSGVRKGESW